MDRLYWLGVFVVAGLGAAVGYSVTGPKNKTAGLALGAAAGVALGHLKLNREEPAELPAPATPPMAGAFPRYA